uniref:Uncharacterized protein n=1 Tax=Tetradesmus obliquus TaxID=3088 RepID=A0A383VMV4_TETOB|eukprot:jgi/Sobl393_1/15352/SZX66149.1
MAACLQAAAAGQMQCKIINSSDSDSSTSVAGKAALDARLQSFRQWLFRNARLLQSLDIAVPAAAVQAAGIPAALQQAAATQGAASLHIPAATQSSSSSSALQLQHFRGPLLTPLLRRLPGHSLTSLVIADDEAHEQTDDWEAAARVQRSLRHLTRLQRLVLVEGDGMVEDTNTNLLVPVLSHMQQLTFLDIGITRGMPQVLHHLPASLVELNISAIENGYGETDENWERPLGNFLFGQLTALTKLSLVRGVGEDLLPGDVLPASLVELRCSSVPSPEPLLHLQHLRLLAMGDTMPADGLRQLPTALMELQHVDSCYHTSLVAAEAAAGWSCLPLQSLEIFAEGDFRLPSLRHIAGLTGWRSLKLNISCPDHHVQTYVQWSSSDLAAVLGELKQLEAFELHGSGMFLPDGAPSTEHSLQIVRAAAGLSQLQSLQLAHVEFGRQAAMQLSGLSQLTQLKLVGCSLVDYDVNVLALQLTALRVLEVPYNPRFGDSVLPVIAHHLQQLSSLQKMHTGVTELGLQWLRGMQQLRKLGVCRGLASSPALAETHLDVDHYACAVCP